MWRSWKWVGGGGKRENKHWKVVSHSAREVLESEEATVSKDHCT